MMMLEDRRGAVLDHELRHWLAEGKTARAQGPGPIGDFLAGVSAAEDRQFALELRQAEVQDLSSGGFWVSDTWAAELVSAAEDENPLRRAGARLLTTETGAPLGLPAVDDTDTEGALVGESGALAQVDVPARRLIVPTYMYSSGPIVVSWALAQDLGERLATYIAEIAGKRIERRLARSLTVGVGANDVAGIVDGAALGVTAAAAAAITADEVLDLVDSAPAAWRWAPSAVLMCSSATYSAVRRLRSSDGAFLWSDDPTGRTRGILAGCRVVLNQWMPAMAAGNRSLVCLALDRFTIRDVASAVLLRLDERYAQNAQTGFIAWARHGGALLSIGSAAAAVALQQAS